MKVTRINEEVYTIELDAFDKNRLHMVASIRGTARLSPYEEAAGVLPSVEIADLIKSIVYEGVLILTKDIVAAWQQVPPAQPIKIGIEPADDEKKYHCGARDVIGLDLDQPHIKSEVEPKEPIKKFPAILAELERNGATNER